MSGQVYSNTFLCYNNPKNVLLVPTVTQLCTVTIAYVTIAGYTVTHVDVLKNKKRCYQKSYSNICYFVTIDHSNTFVHL